ncbi:MAG TPA: gamma-glutamyl-phosphate reductase, partial [Alphaproteobacteria bacterium]|nr:gamma-glutamyl-phosphate reductase [Alphaproteobacteria bacterium]
QALSVASIDQRNTAVTEAANALRARTAEVLAANAKDVEGVQGSGKDAAFIDRLTLTEDRVAAMADAL